MSDKVNRYDLITGEGCGESCGAEMQNRKLGDWVKFNDHDLAMRRKDLEIKLLREQRNELNYGACHTNKMTHELDAEITKAVGEVL